MLVRTRVIVYCFLVPTMVMTVIVAVAVSAKYDEPDQVGKKTDGADNQDKLWVIDVGRIEKSGDGLQNDRDAKSDEKDCIEEGTKDFGSQPLFASFSVRESARSYIFAGIARRVLQRTP